MSPYFRFWITVFGLLWSVSNAQSGIRATVGEWASRGSLDSAQSWVASQLESNAALENKQEARLVLGQLTLRGLHASRLWQEIKAEKELSTEQAEALYLLGQYQYAAGRYHMAIPEFRDYLRRYPKGEDADRAGYWMANACLHLALTQTDRQAYLDTGLTYIKRIPSFEKPGSYYAALAIECQAKLLLAKSDAKGADSLLTLHFTHAPEEERPAFYLLKAQTLRTLSKPYSIWIDSLLSLYPHSPESQYANRFKGKIPAVLSIRDAKKDTVNPAKPVNPSDTAQSFWVLQVGSFAQQENAQSFLEQLAKAGLQARIMTSSRGNQSLWQVWLGRFHSAAEAENFGAKELQPKQILFTSRFVEP